MDQWFTAYKAWEAKDTFNEAVKDNRLAMRSFGSAFNFQVSKTKPVGITTGRFLGPGRVKLDDATHSGPYQAMNLPQHKRGIDNSAYANPANFASRAVKYAEGLHDVSMRLYKPGEDIRAISHHKGEATPHFSFVALSKGEDQFVIYKLGQYGKALKATFPQMAELTREYKSKMTRVKLASDYDMGTGYVAVPTPGQADGLAYKVTYSLGNTLKTRGVAVPPRTTVERLQQRQQQYFKSRSDIVKFAANEIVVALRQHAGPFPVTAVYEGGVLMCYDVEGETGEGIFNGRTISANGVVNW